MRPLLLFAALILFLRLPFLNHAVQGDDAFYLAKAEHAQIEPLHPNNLKYITQGIEVDMRGFPHPPGNAWILAGLLAVMGDIHEIPFHAAYIVFSWIAVAAVWSLAKRFCLRPIWGTLLFIATPAFVINGTSFEADLPFLACWLSAVALFVQAVDRKSLGYLAAAALAMAAAEQTAYQGVVLIPILGYYLFLQRRDWKPAWAVLLVPALVFLGWQYFERSTTGASGAQVMSGYFDSYGYQRLAFKLRNAAALTVHLGWMVSPLFGAAIALVLAVPALFYDFSPLFWLPFGLGLATLWIHRGRKFLNAWLLIFFAAALVIFFAGSARYLLPLAAPLAFLTVNRFYWRDVLLGTGFVLQLALALALAASNQTQWNTYRTIAQTAAPQIASHRTFINAEWGLRHYAEAEGAQPLTRTQLLRPGDLVLTSALAAAVPVNSSYPVIGKWQFSTPLRLFGFCSPSAYSSHANGLRAFEISRAPIDFVTLQAVELRKPTVSALPMNAPEADAQILSGVFNLESNAWRWTGPRAVFTLKPPSGPAPVEAEFRIVDQMVNRKVSILIDGAPIAEQTYAKPGLYQLRTPPVPSKSDSVSVTLAVDQPFRVPNDNRDLALILTRIGFVP